MIYNIFYTVKKYIIKLYMSAFSIVTNILAVIGLIVLFAYIVYYLWKYLQDKNQEELDMKVSPPYDYMQQTGVKCPDYWINTGTDDKGYTCKNVNNIATPIKSSNSTCSNIKCNIDGDATSVKFSLLPAGKTWESGDPNGLTSMTDAEKQSFVTTKVEGTTSSRCDWIKCCGAYNTGNSMNNAVWLGINDVCNSAAAPSSM